MNIQEYRLINPKEILNKENIEFVTERMSNSSGIIQVVMNGKAKFYPVKLENPDAARDMISKSLSFYNEIENTKANWFYTSDLIKNS